MPVYAHNATTQRIHYVPKTAQKDYSVQECAFRECYC